MPRLAAAASIAALTLLGLAPAAAALPQLDQSNPDTGGYHGVLRTVSPTTGQTFVAARSGHLTHVRLWLTRYTGTAPITVELRPVSGGTPSSVVLWSTTVTESTSAPLRLPVAVPVTAGTPYALVVDGGAMPADARWLIGMFSTDVYAAGSEVHREEGRWVTAPPYDLAFETFVEADDTTPPITTATAGDGAGGWLAAPAALDVRATDDSTGVAGTRCWIDPPTRPATYAAAGHTACPATLTGGGIRRVWAASVDAAGNAETPRLAEVRVGAPPAPVVVEVPGPVQTVEVPGPARTIEVPGPLRTETRTEVRTVTTPAPPVRATTTATAPLGAGRTVRAGVGCGASTCRATVTAEVRSGKRVVRLTPATMTLAAGRTRRVRLTLSKAQRAKLGKNARVRVTVRTEGAGAAPTVTLG